MNFHHFKLLVEFRKQWLDIFLCLIRKKEGNLDLILNSNFFFIRPIIDLGDFLRGGLNRDKPL